MSGIFGISGVSSGIQWRDMIDQMMQLEARPAAALRARSSALDARAAAWEQFRTRVTALRDGAAALATGNALGRTQTSVTSTAGRALVAVTSTGGAQPGEHSVRVLARAERARLGGDIFSERNSPLDIAGEFLVNGRRVEIGAADSLDAIADRINRAAGTSVAATVTGVPGGYRLVLTATGTGAAGIDLVDGGSRALRALGVVEDAAHLKHQSSAGFRSDAFADATTPLAALRGTAGASGTVGFGSGATAFHVALDLATQSLDYVRDAINTAAEAALSSVRATIVTETAGGVATARLQLSGTAAATDQNGVLEQLGVLAGGRGAVRHEIAAAVLGAGATATTSLNALGAGAGDTIRFTGSRANGTGFTIEHVVGASDTVQTLLDRLNGSDGFDGSATAHVSADGRLTVRATAGGASGISLAAFAGNEGGGSFDTGDFQVTSAGRAREIVAGSDAIVEIDGMRVTRATNTIADAVPGLTLAILAAAPHEVSEVTVSRDVAGAANAVRQFVEAYNALAAFTDAGLGQSGAARPPLAGDLVARGMRDMLRAGLETRVSGGPGGVDRLGAIGVTIGRDGRYTIDAERLDAALRSDLSAVTRLFQAHGEASTAALSYVAAGDRTAVGTHAVVVTRAATRASASGAGFNGTYVATGPNDRLTITDGGSGARYSVALEDGLGIDALVTRLNAEFISAARHRASGSATLYADAEQDTPATGATRLADLHAANGTGLGLEPGTALTFSGVDAGGAAFVATFTIEDPAAQTLDDVRAAIAARFGGDADVSVDGGRLVIRAAREGASPIQLQVSSSAGAVEYPFGTIDTAQQGRDATLIRAEAHDGQIRLVHGAFGSAAGLTVEYSDGVDGLARLGLAAGSWSGTDVAGTIGGHAAIGAGQRLTGAAGSPVDGLVLAVAENAAGAIGAVTFGRGAAAATQQLADLLLGANDGSISSTRARTTASAARFNTRADEIEERLESRRESLIRRFTAMERALASAQAQSQWLTTQLASLQPRQRQ